MQVEISRICTPTDFSETADHAVRYGAALAEQFGAELHLLHVLDDIRDVVMHPDMTALVVSMLISSTPGPLSLKHCAKSCATTTAFDESVIC